MSKRNTVRRAASALLAACMAGTLAACGGSGGADGADAANADYASYDVVVTAWDTPQQVLDALAAEGVTPLEYFDGDTLLTPDEIAAYDGDVSVYLCEGTYEAGEGDFILSDGEKKLTVTGAGADKTLVQAGGGLRENRGAAIAVRGGNGARISDMTLSGFSRGVLVENASDVRVENVTLSGNTFAGVQLAGAQGCRIENCTFTENGAPGAGESGYGLSLDALCAKNTGKGNTYSGNGNANAVDYPSLWAQYTENGNDIELAMESGARAEQPVLRDLAQEARNARPGENALRYEIEDAGYIGASESTDGGKMENASEGAYVFLFDGTITMLVDVPQAGNYRLFVVGGSDDGNNKCDYVQVNGGERYLTSYPGGETGSWQLSQPGTELWENNVLVPQAPAEGFAFQEGQNEITITANWGYCAYDCIYLEQIDAGAAPATTQDAA